VAHPTPDTWRLYLALTKPKVVALIVLTAIVGTLLATPGLPPWEALVFGNIGIALAAASAATLNQYLDQRIDARMARTRSRPLPTGGLTDRQALTFAAVLAVASMALLWLRVNPLTALLTFASLIGYAGVYTVWLKRATPQNIVIGGAAGAAPPVLGWAAVTGTIHPHALLLFLIIFTWTPPHFWALALFVQSDYAKAGIPMMPVVAGQASTRRQILAYAVILLAVSLAPWWIGGVGAIYAVAALALSAVFVALCVPVAFRRASEGDTMKPEKRLFAYSVLYLFALFAALVVDRVILGQGVAL